MADLHGLVPVGLLNNAEVFPGQLSDIVGEFRMDGHSIGDSAQQKQHDWEQTAPME